MAGSPLLRGAATLRQLVSLVALQRAVLRTSHFCAGHVVAVSAGWAEPLLLLRWALVPEFGPYFALSRDLATFTLDAGP